MAKINKGKADIVDAIENGRYSETLMDRLFDLESEEKMFKAAMADAHADTPDIHPNIAGILRHEGRAAARGTENSPAYRDEAADAIRGLIKRVTRTPGTKRGEVHMTLQGEFGAIFEWLSGRERK